MCCFNIDEFGGNSHKPAYPGPAEAINWWLVHYNFSLTVVGILCYQWVLRNYVLYLNLIVCRYFFQTQEGFGWERKQTTSDQYDIEGSSGADTITSWCPALTYQTHCQRQSSGAPTSTSVVSCMHSLHLHRDYADGDCKKAFMVRRSLCWEGQSTCQLYKETDFFQMKA